MMISSEMKPLASLLPLLLFPAMIFAHPVPESPMWLTCPGGEGLGKGKHIVLVSADQEYRGEH